jgi:hypothetical protein
MRDEGSIGVLRATIYEVSGAPEGALLYSYQLCQEEPEVLLVDVSDKVSVSDRRDRRLGEIGTDINTEYGHHSSITHSRYAITLTTPSTSWHSLLERPPRLRWQLRAASWCSAAR